MKKEVNPAVLIGVGVVAVILLIAFAIRSLAPHPPEATIPPANMQNEADLKRQNIQKYNSSQPAATPAGASKSAGSERTGD